MAEFRPGTDDADPLNLLASVVWALDTAEGEIARRFAEHEPTPDISWFGPGGTIAKPALLPSSPIAYGLSLWASKHLTDEALTRWASTSSEPLFPEFRDAVEQKLTEKHASIGEPSSVSGGSFFWQKREPTTIAHMRHRSAKSGPERSAAMLDQLRPRLLGPMPSDRGWYSLFLGEKRDRT